MAERLIDPNLRFGQVFIDEVHWICLTSLAREKSISPDQLLGTILEHVFVKLGRIDLGEERVNPFKVEIQIEPIREDKSFLEALVTEREGLEEDRQQASLITAEDRAQLNWHGM